MTSRRRTSLTTVTLVLVGFVLAVVSSGTQRFRPEEAVRGVFGGVQRVFSGIGRGVGNTVRSVGELRRLPEKNKKLIGKK